MALALTKRVLSLPVLGSRICVRFTTTTHAATTGDDKSKKPISRTRTTTTAKLWEARLAEIEKCKQHRIKQPDSETATIDQSTVEIVLPFKSDTLFHDQYRRFDGGVRFGMILEDLDAFAGNVAHLYVRPPRPDISIVTAACDSIKMKTRFPMDVDLIMKGLVSWVGKSSLEVCINIFDPVLKNPVCDACFLMVARDDKVGKSYTVPRLTLETDEEKKLFERGARNAQIRKEEAAQSLDIVPPTADELKLVHAFILEGAQATDKILMKNTEMETVTMTQPQERNQNNKIFGGYLMRAAYELARATAYNFCGPKSHPYFYAVDDISFLKPVEIGSIIRFKSKVVYAKGYPDPAVQIRVDTAIQDMKTGNRYSSNVFHFTYLCPELPIRGIVPETYKEAMEYLDGKRRREHVDSLGH